MWRRWVEFTSRTESGTSIALFRVLIGLCVVLNMAMVLGDGLVPMIWADVAHGGIAKVRPGLLVRALGGATPEVMGALAWANVALGVALAVGLGGRITAFVTLQVFSATVDINGLAGGSYDELLQNGLWLCVLGPTTATLSLDSRIRTGSWRSGARVGVWARYLIVLQLVLMYGSTGLQKMSSYWTPGGDFSALYYILQQPSWHRVDMRWLADVFVVTQIGTATSWLWEVCAPLWLLAFYWSETAGRPGVWRARFNRWRVREIYAAIGVVFHAALLVLMDVGPFSPVSLAFYAALVHPWEYERTPRGG